MLSFGEKKVMQSAVIYFCRSVVLRHFVSQIHIYDKLSGMLRNLSLDRFNWKILDIYQGFSSNLSRIFQIENFHTP